MWSQNFCLPSWTTPTNSTTPITTPGVNRTRCSKITMPLLLELSVPNIQIVDSHPSGYPRFSALLSTYDPFILCRRFTRIRARLLLLKQDKLAMLEQRLDEVDLNETSPLFLGKSRSDMNADRISLLAEIEISLADYGKCLPAHKIVHQDFHSRLFIHPLYFLDQFADRTHRMLGFTPARERDIQSLCNWTEGTGCLAREETAYLTHPWELTSLAPAGDNAMVQLEAWIEDKLIRFYRGFHQVGSIPLTQH